MARQKKPSSAESLLGKLLNWQKENNLTDDHNLNILIQDLQNNRNLKLWAERDPLSYLPMPTSHSQKSRINRTNLIIGLRNMAVFLPVALTWASISVVTASFAKYETDNPNSLTNFLEFWQRGYGYINDFWKLSNVAITDVFLVMLIIVLTYLINNRIVKENDLENEENKQIINKRNEIAQLIFEYLYDYRYPTNQDLTRNLYSATKALSTSIKSLSKIIVRLERDISKYPDSRKLVSELKNLNKEVKKITKK